MKRFLTILLFVAFGISTVFAQTFTATAPTGQTLGYVIIDGTNNVCVASIDQSISGNLTIPSSVSYSYKFFFL